MPAFIATFYMNSLHFAQQFIDIHFARSLICGYTLNVQKVEVCFL